MFEIIYETKVFDEYNIVPSSYKYILHKYPQYQEQFLTDSYYDDYIKIFIIRNPIFVFSSLNKRKFFKLSNYHSLDKYITILNKFIYYQNNPIKNLYTIKYEDLFENNYQNLKEILNSINLQYNNEIFNNNKYNNYSHVNVEIPYLIKPKDNDHKKYRTWQINQPFVLNNNTSKINLTKIQKEKIINNDIILKLYPNIKNTFRNIDTSFSLV